MSNMATAHIKAYRLVHDMRRSMGFKDTKVGFAISMKVFKLKNSRNPVCKARASEEERIYQEVVVQAMTTGNFRRPLKNNGRDRRGCYCDFHALNYYSSCTVSTFDIGSAEGSFKNDLGWEIYPQGIVECCKKLEELAPVPIYITENGACDLNDCFRSRYIYEHLQALCRSKLPVKRYYYWCFNDNFEWAEGYYARFGLVHTDFDTMERTVKRSGEFYSKIIKNRGVSEELYQEYVAGESYHY
jgi:beta-glucosidase